MAKTKPEYFHPEKIVVGLTGGFGCGKSTVAHLFEELGACTVDADRLTHEGLAEGSEIYSRVASLFKEAKTQKALDRKKIADVIFRDPAKRTELEEIIHPYVFRRIVEELGDSPAAVAVVEVPLLFETGFHQYCHRTVAVTASEAAVRQRLKDKGFSPAEIMARNKAQLSPEEKARRADDVIDNSGNFDRTRRAVRALWEKIRKGS